MAGAFRGTRYDHDGPSRNLVRPHRGRARELILAGTILAALIAGAAWVSFEVGGRPARIRTEDLPLDRAPIDELASPSTTSSRRAETSPTVTFVSSAGLPIERVLLQETDEAGKLQSEWRRLYTADGVLEPEALSRAVRVCAPGHRARPYDPAAATIVLDPDAMLIVRAPGLRGCVEARSDYPDDATSVGFLDDDRIGCAVARHLMSEDERAEGCGFILEWKALQTTRLMFRPAGEGAVEWATACPPEPETAALVLRVAGPEGTRIGTLQVGVQCPERLAPQAGSGTRSFDWGTETTWVDWWGASRRSVNRDGEIRFEGAPKGERIRVVAQDRRSRAYIATTVQNDGTVHELELLPPLVLRGSVASADGSPLPQTLEIDWHQHFEAGGPAVWTTRSNSLRPGPDGGFMLTGPQHIDDTAAAARDIPRVAEIEVKAGGFLPSKQVVMVTGWELVESQAWTLEPLEPDFHVLAPDEPFLLAEGSRLLIPDAHSTPVRRVARAWTQADGRYAVVLAPAFGRHGDPELMNARMSAVQHMAVTLGSKGLCGFTRVDERVFRQEPLAHHKLELEVEAESGPVYAALEWNGIRGDQTKLRSSGGKLLVSCRAPSERLRLRWSCVEDEARVEWVPITRPQQRFELSGCPEPPVE